MRTTRVIYYLASIVYHYFLMFTWAGNYWHGGTPFEAIVLSTSAILISWTAVRIVSKVQPLERVIMILFGMLPMIDSVFSIAQTLNAVTELVFGLRLFGR
jgi:hypothetical protein